MKRGDIAEELHRASDDGVVWADLATVESVEEHPAFGSLVNLVEHPGSGRGEPRRVQARLIRLGSRDKGGMNWPVEEGDEALVIYPGGDPNRAVALVGLTSRKAQVPSSHDGSHVDVVHPGGMEVRRTEDAEVSGVVISAELLADLQSFVAAMTNFVTAVTGAALANPATPVTTGVLATFLQTPPEGAPVLATESPAFQAKLTTSVNAGPGLPYASPTLKTE